MRPTLSLASLVFSLTALASPAAHAAPPPAAAPADPFQAAPPAPAPSGEPLTLRDPFAVAPASAPASDGLTDPFAVAPAPRCPVQTTGSGLVVQRPAGVPCPRAPEDAEEIGLRDPFGA